MAGRRVAQVWAPVIAIDGASCSGSSRKKIRSCWRAAPSGEKPRSAWLELEPLKNVQVWRFALYYFFVFGAFVALSLWLPRYLIGVYKLDIETAGMMAAAFSIPASVFRAYGGDLSDRYGARRIMYWMFGVSVADHLHPGLSADRLCRADDQRPVALPSWRPASSPSP